jgi:hypothetical protein
VDRGVAGAWKRRAAAGKLDPELAEPVPPREEHEQQRSEPEHVGTGGARGRDRRRGRPDRAVGDVRDERGGHRDRGREQQPVGDALVEREAEDEEADVPVEQRIDDAEVRAVQPEQDVLPVADDDAAADEQSGADADSQLHGEGDPSTSSARRVPAGGRDPLRDPHVAEQQRDRSQADQARRQPPAREDGPEHALLPELVEPQQLRLEVGDDPGEQRGRGERGERERGAEARPAPPPRRLLVPGGAGRVAVGDVERRPLRDRAWVANAGPHEVEVIVPPVRASLDNDRRSCDRRRLLRAGGGRCSLS